MLADVLYRALAELTLVAHFAFIMFAALGGFLVLRWRRLLWWHVLAVAWAALVELAGLGCPLTPIENALRVRGGGASYPGGFLQHYLEPIVYPAALTRDVQIALGALLLAVNGAIYARLVGRQGWPQAARRGNSSARPA